MSISVDEPGIPHTGLTAAISELRHGATSSGVHPAYKRALRYGTPGTPHHITVAGNPVTIVIADHPNHPIDPARERASWIELRQAITGRTDNADTAVTHALPTEIAAAIWEHDGRQVRICRPGAAAAIRRAKNRLRRGLSVLSPGPLIAAIAQPLTSSATALGLALTPVLPPAHQPPPSPPSAQTQTPSTGDIQRPALPWTPGLMPAAVTAHVTRRARPADDTAPDTEDAPPSAPTPPDQASPVEPADPARTGAASPKPTGTEPTPEPQQEHRAAPPTPADIASPAPMLTPGSSPTTEPALTSPEP